MVEGDVVYWQGVSRVEQGRIRKIEEEWLLVDLPNGKQMTLKINNLIRQDND